MITTGVDLASQALKTAACSITWADDRAAVTDPIPGGVNDGAILKLLSTSDKVGFDVPLGWPAGFVAAISSHAQGRPWPGGNLLDLRFRETDRYVAGQSSGGHLASQVICSPFRPSCRCPRVAGVALCRSERNRASGRGVSSGCSPALGVQLPSLQGQGLRRSASRPGLDLPGGNEPVAAT